MRVSVLVPIAIVMTVSPAVKQDAASVISVTRDISSGSTESYNTVAASPGDLLSGTIEWRATCANTSLIRPGCTIATVSFLDASGKSLRDFSLWMLSGDAGPNTLPVGFVAPTAGTYKVQVSASSGASYVLELGWQSAAERLKEVRARPREDYRSDRIDRLMRDVEADVPRAEETFWTEMESTGTPIIEAKDETGALVTFVWKASYETRNVLVQWPPAGSRADDYYMTHVPRTRVWYKTVRALRGTRVSYSLSPNDRSGDREFTSQPDPLNRRRAFDDAGPLSLLELPGAPDERWARETPLRRGRVEPLDVESPQLRKRLQLYTPPDYRKGGGPYPLVVLFNAFAYTFGAIDAPRIVDNLIADRRIRPPVVCFIQQEVGVNNSTAVKALADALANELLPDLRSEYSVSSDARDIVLGGYSASAALAARIALAHPSVFGNVLSQSGAFGQESHSQAAVFRDTPRVPVRFYMDSGLYENFPAAGRPVDEMALVMSNTIGNRHFRDVLLAKGYDVIYRETAGAHDGLHWRATLPEALMALLAPR